MTAPKFSIADIKQLVGFTVYGCALYFGLTARMSEIEAKIDLALEKRDGRDMLQDLKIGNLESDVSKITDWKASFSSQPAEKPKRIYVEPD